MTSGVLAEGILENFTGPGLGWFGGVMFTLIVVACYFLFRNMFQRIKRLPDSFDEPADGSTDAAGASEPPSQVTERSGPEGPGPGDGD